MPNKLINRQVFADASWWHWLLTVPLLALHLAGHSWAIVATMVLCGIAGSYFMYRIRKFKPYPVQVRIAYLGLLVAGVFPGMQWIHWVQLFGTTAMVTVGYCPLIRMLSLAPLNRNEPLTVSLVWHAFVREPCAGGLIQWSVNSKNPTVACCSLPSHRSDLTPIEGQPK
jgi:hypothetical protein